MEKSNHQDLYLTVQVRPSTSSGLKEAHYVHNGVIAIYVATTKTGKTYTGVANPVDYDYCRRIYGTKLSTYDYSDLFGQLTPIWDETLKALKALQLVYPDAYWDNSGNIYIGVADKPVGAYYNGSFRLWFPEEFQSKITDRAPEEIIRSDHFTVAYCDYYDEILFHHD